MTPHTNIVVAFDLMTPSFQQSLSRSSWSSFMRQGGSQEEIEKVMVACGSPSAFLGVPTSLQRIRRFLHITLVIFSNMQKTMVNNSVMRSANLFPRARIFQDIITVDDVQRYKPTREVYFYLAEKICKQMTRLSELWLIHGNLFDVTGAKNVGLRAARVDRAGIGREIE